MQRGCKQTGTLNQSISEHVERLLKEARGTPPGFARDQLLRLSRQVETASHIQLWLSSTGLQAPQ
jgi:hypothetical protein